MNRPPINKMKVINNLTTRATQLKDVIPGQVFFFNNDNMKFTYLMCRDVNDMKVKYLVRFETNTAFPYEDFDHLKEDEVTIIKNPALVFEGTEEEE